MWATAVARDDHQCRVAPFLPDRPCTGSLDIYNPDDPSVDPTDADRAVTVCDGHKAWLAANPDDAADLGLIHARR